ncbi:MAG: hypothetical protein Q9224_007583, partial [Gallowayella concinna]
NLLGRYSTTDILLESDLHSRMLQSKLTPNLGNFIPSMKEELLAVLDDELPECKGEVASPPPWASELILHPLLDRWTPVKIHPICLKIVARISARVFVGFPLCRNAEWLETSIQYTENVFRTVVALRLFPKVLQPLVSLFTPQAWKVPQNLHKAQKLIVPLVLERKRAQLTGDPNCPKHNDLLQWMMDAADEREGKPEKLAHRQLLLTLAAIHTSTMAATHVLFDLCARPEYIEDIRTEIVESITVNNGWQKQTLNGMPRLDSFLKESQRVTPPSLCQLLPAQDRSPIAQCSMLTLRYHKWP